MTMSLYWIPDNIQGHDLSDELKYTLRKKISSPIDITLDDSNIPYLQGVKDSGIEGAETLIAAIRKYDRVRVYEE